MRAYVACAEGAEIAVLALEGDSGALQRLQTVPVGGVVMPLALSPDRRTLYASLRSAPFRVLGFRIDGRGWLSPLGEAALPESMANIATDRSGRWLFAASYGGHVASIGVLATDGTPGPVQQVLPTGRNAHAALPSPDNRFLFITNLGSDQVMQMRFDATSGQVEPNDPPLLACRPGAGPRHLVFHPGGRWAYLLNELDAGVDLLELDTERGTLALRRTWSTLPAGFDGKPWSADIHLTPDGRHLYTSERTGSLLTGWRVDADTGELGLIGHWPTETQPRGFKISPDGRWLLAAGQVSNRITSYRIDADSGALTPVAWLPLGRGPNWVEIIESP